MSILGPSLPSAAAAAAAAAARHTVRPRAARRARTLASAPQWVVPQCAAPLRTFTSSAKGKQKAVDEPVLLFEATRSADGDHVDTHAGRGFVSQHDLQSLIEYRAVYGRPGQSSKQQLPPSAPQHASHIRQDHRPSTSTSTQSTQLSDSACSPAKGPTQTTPASSSHPRPKPTRTTSSTTSRLPEDARRDSPKSAAFSPGKARRIRTVLREHLQHSSDLPHSLLVQSVEQFWNSLPAEREFTFQEAALILMNYFLKARNPRDAGTTRGSYPVDADDLHIATHLYDLSLADVDSPGVTTRGICVAYLPFLYRQLLLANTFEDSTRAAQLLADPRIKRPQLRVLYYESVEPLRRLCESSTKAKLGQVGERKRRELLRLWQAAIERLVDNGTIPLFSVPTDRLNPDQGFKMGSVQYKWDKASYVMMDFLLILAEFAEGLSVVPFCEKVRNNIGPSLVRLHGEGHWATDDATLSRIPLLPHHLMPSIMQALIDRNSAPQAALILSLYPVAYRRPEFYAALLEQFGEGRLLHGEIGQDFEPNAGLDAISSMTSSEVAPSKHLSKISDAWSRGFQEQLWTQAMGHPDIQGNVKKQLKLFEARMVSHGKLGSAHLVMEDLQEMWRRELLPEVAGEWSTLGHEGNAQRIAHAISVLSRRGQMGVIQAFMASDRRDLGDKVVEELARLMDMPHEKSKHKSVGKGSWGSHMLNASTEPILRDAMSPPQPRSPVHQPWVDRYPPATPETYVSRVRYLEEKLGLNPDAVTRNQILLALARIRLPWLGRPSPGQPRPSAPEQKSELIALLDMFVKCGILVSPDRTAPYIDKYDLAPISCPKTFLHSGTTILKAMVSLLFERGWIVEARRVLHWLKEGEKEAERRVMEQKDK